MARLSMGFSRLKENAMQVPSRSQEISDKRQKLFSKSSSIPSSSLESNKFMPRRPPELSDNELDQVRRSVSLQVKYDMSMIRGLDSACGVMGRQFEEYPQVLY